ncbi:MAG: pyridoxal phosphate-dependent aminotransferase [Bacteroidota bacterium]
MPSISEKGQAMPSSPIRKLVPYAEAAKKNGKKVYHLNIGQPDIHSPNISLEAVKNIDLKVIEYSHSAGFESYRKGLARYYQSVDIDVSHEEIIITTGGSEALIFGMLSCLNHGEQIIIPEPYYANYNGFSVTSGVDVVPISTSIDTGFSLPPVEEWEKKITAKTKAILICNPGNPTGCLYSKEELSVLAEIVKKHDLFLFCDEVYREFVYDGAEHFSCMNLEGLEQHVILIDSVSKRYSMCGARIGALVTKNKDVYSTAMKFAQARLSPPTLAQIASEAALETPQDYFDEVIEEYRSRRDLLVSGLNAIEGVTCPKPGGAFYCIAQLPIDDSDKFCQWILESFDLNNETVMMAPATGFYDDRNSGINQVRIAYVLENKSLAKAIEIIGIALKNYPGRTLSGKEELNQVLGN